MAFRHPILPHSKNSKPPKPGTTKPPFLTPAGLPAGDSVVRCRSVGKRFLIVIAAGVAALGSDRRKLVQFQPAGNRQNHRSHRDASIPPNSMFTNT